MRCYGALVYHSSFSRWADRFWPNQVPALVVAPDSFGFSLESVSSNLSSVRLMSCAAAADHFPTEGADGSLTETLDSGKQAVVSPPWTTGLAFTPDFRFAFPRTH